MANIKSNIEIEITKNEKNYHFVIPMGVSFGEAADAAYEVMQVIQEWAKQSAKTSLETQQPTEG